MLKMVILLFFISMCFAAPGNLQTINIYQNIFDQSLQKYRMTTRIIIFSIIVLFNIYVLYVYFFKGLW